MNFGVPRELLMDESSVLYDLTRKLPPNERKLIYETANASLDFTQPQKRVENTNNFFYDNKAMSPSVEI
jgi:hypothetical protein